MSINDQGLASNRFVVTISLTDETDWTRSYSIYDRKYSDQLPSLKCTQLIVAVEILAGLVQTAVEQVFFVGRHGDAILEEANIMV